MEAADARQAFEVKRAEHSLQARLAKPILGLFKDLPELLGHLLSRLGSHGIGLPDVKFEPAGDSLADIHLKLSAATRGIARLYLDRVEVESAPYSAAADDLDDLIVGVVDALKAFSPDASFESYIVKHAFHGQIPEVPAAEFLARFAASAPSAFGSPIGSGVIFYYGTGPETFASSVTIDLSRIFGEGLFFQVHAIYNASAVALDAVAPLSMQKVNDVLGEIGLRF